MRDKPRKRRLRKVDLFGTYVTIKLERCASVEQCCDNILTTQNLNEMYFKVADEWVGTIFLAGLPEEYRPIQMGIESSRTKITGDSIKVNWLQDVNSCPDPKSTAMYVKEAKKFQKHKVK